MANQPIYDNMQTQHYTPTPTVTAQTFSPKDHSIMDGAMMNMCNFQAQTAHKEAKVRKSRKTGRPVGRPPKASKQTLSQFDLHQKQGDDYHPDAGQVTQEVTQSRDGSLPIETSFADQKLVQSVDNSHD